MCRLAGHKGVITKLAFMKDHNIIISASKDTFVKFWDLDTEHNFKTLVGHGSEVNIKHLNIDKFILYNLIITLISLIKVWGLVLAKNDQYLVTGCNDNELRVWKISFTDGDATSLEINLQDLSLNNDADISDAVYFY